MTNYFLLAIYFISLLSIFIVPLYVNIRRDRVVALSFLPTLLIAFVVSISMLTSDVYSNASLARVYISTIVVFFELLFFGYLMMLPILILVAFIIEYLRINYHYSPIKLALIGGSIGAITVATTFMSWKFVWTAFISGFVAVLIQYYFTEYKKSKSK